MEQMEIETVQEISRQKHLEMNMPIPAQTIEEMKDEIFSARQEHENNLTIGTKMQIPATQRQDLAESQDRTYLRSPHEPGRHQYQSFNASMFK